MKRAMLALAVLMTCILPISISHAGDDGGYSSTRYAIVGPLDAINLNQYTMVVGDVQMRLAVHVRVRDPNGSYMALAQLRPGTRVGVVSAADATNMSNLVAEIHVLGAGHARSGSEN